MKVGIVGLGLIGGSLAKDLRANSHYIIGYDINATHQHMAKDYGMVDQILELEALVEEVDVIIVSIPVQEIVEVLKNILDIMPWNVVLIDTSSTKANICASIKNHKKRGRFVACHPLSGTEHSGPQSAIDGLFKGKKNIICEDHLSDEDALQLVLQLIEEVGMQTLLMHPEEHDVHMAYVSHLSHISSFMLGSTVLAIEKDKKQISNLASTGFESTVRLAKSSPETWAGIFSDNSKNVLNALNSYIDHLCRFRDAIQSGDIDYMKSEMEQANEIKRILAEIKKNGVTI